MCYHSWLGRHLMLRKLKSLNQKDINTLIQFCLYIFYHCMTFLKFTIIIWATVCVLPHEFALNALTNWSVTTKIMAWQIHGCTVKLHHDTYPILSVQNIAYTGMYISVFFIFTERCLCKCNIYLLIVCRKIPQICSFLLLFFCRRPLILIKIIRVIVSFAEMLAIGHSECMGFSCICNHDSCCTIFYVTPQNCFVVRYLQLTLHPHTIIWSLL